MASNFLLLTGEAIAEGLDLTSGDKEQFLKLNRHQCKCVAWKMSESREVLQVLEPAVGYVVRCEAALKELYRVVTNALSLIKDCRFAPAPTKDDRKRLFTSLFSKLDCSKPSLSKDDHHESWLRAAITQRSYERSEDFAQICYDLQWCTSIVSICCLQSAATLQDPILVPEDCDGRLGAVDLFKLQRAANQDRDDLRSNLEPLKQGHVCDGSCELSQTDSSLAAHLLERLNSKPTPTTTEILTSSLWKVDAQDLPDGKVLAGGSFAIVLETEWLGQKHAKKVFFGTQEGSFKTESEVLAGLSHPHLLRIVGSSVNRREKNCALIMELMQGDLFNFLEDITVPLSILTALDLMLQVARGLKYLHSRRIVHRDLKSKNILVASLTGAPELEPCRNAKLADFGLSKPKNSSTAYSRQTLNVGTRKWMAPEIFKIPQDEIDNGSMEPPDPRAHPFKADVYSFAIVCSEILTQKEPFPGVPLSDLLKHIRDGRRPDLPNGCPRRLASLIKRCWQLEPRRRPDFPEICRELRYIKGLLLTGFDATGDERKDREVGILPSPTWPTKIYPVHQLYPDPELRNLDHRHDLTLIFFHGFSNGTDAWEKTWIERGDPFVCWPRNWLHKHEEGGGLGGDILVLSISFDGNPGGAHESVEDIGKNLLQSLVNNSKWNFHQDSQQIVLVGHSFGGLVIKSLMVEVDKAIKERTRSAIEKNKQARCKSFQVNVKGIMFYAVPHIGADKNFKTYLTDCNNIPFLRNSKRLTGLMRSVDAFNRQMVELSTDFEYSVPTDINLYAIVEGQQV
ncbi:hypothetical protein CY35_10G006100 [Sphagnum magellanicum]|nr:hypothetical protein CY35_10G006100 [Sphagnum magellanicum]